MRRGGYWEVRKMGRVEEKEGRMEEKIASPACSYRR